MNFVGLLTPLLAIGFLIERILEAAFNLAEMIPGVNNMKTNNSAQYGKIKPIVSVVVGILLGIIIANMLSVSFFTGIGLANLNGDADQLISGAAAGASAPYVHQIIELLFKAQKLLETQKERIEESSKPTP